MLKIGKYYKHVCGCSSGGEIFLVIGKQGYDFLVLLLRSGEITLFAVENNIEL